MLGNLKTHPANLYDNSLLSRILHIMADLRAVQYIRHGSFQEALRFIPEDQEYVRNMLQFWILRKRAFEREDDPGKLVQLTAKEWEVFYRLYLQIGIEQEYYQAIKEWVFTLMRSVSRKALDNTEKTEIIYYLGVSHLMLQEYHDALTWANHAVKKEPENMKYLAFLANCWERLGHDFQARLLYRESFYQGPERIEIACIGSQIIDAIIERILKFHYPIESIRYWIPVFGRIFSLFNVKRALTTLEYSSLVKRVRTLEGIFEDEDSEADFSVLPRLLNGYLWMIDYYESTGRSREKVEEIESQFFSADSSVYQLYIEYASRSK